MSGPGLLTTATEVVGYSGTGTFTQTAGTNSTGTLSLAYSAGSSGTYNLTGGKLIASQIAQGAGAAQVNFSGGTLQAGGTFSSSVPMTLGSSGGGATVASGGYTMTFSGSLSGSGGLTKTDAGALVLAASNIYSGGTALDAGALVAANGSEGSATGSGSVTLNGGTLASAAERRFDPGQRAGGVRRLRHRPRRDRHDRPAQPRQLDHRSRTMTLNFDLTTPRWQRRSVDDYRRADSRPAHGHHLRLPAGDGRRLPPNRRQFRNARSQLFRSSHRAFGQGVLRYPRPWTRDILISWWWPCPSPPRSSCSAWARLACWSSLGDGDGWGQLGRANATR